VTQKNSISADTYAVPRDWFGAKAKVELVPDAATEQGKCGTTTVFAARINRRIAQ